MPEQLLHPSGREGLAVTARPVVDPPARRQAPVAGADQVLQAVGGADEASSPGKRKAEKAWNVSSPPRSADSRGPVTARRRPNAVLTARSIASAEATPPAQSASASRSRANWSRFPRNPSISRSRTTGCLPAARSTSHTQGDDRGSGLRPGADLDKGDELGRVPEVGGDGPLPVPDAIDEPAHWLAARGGQHGRWRARLVEALEDRVFQGLVLGNRLDHQVGARRVIERGRHADPSEDPLDLARRPPARARHEGPEALANPHQRAVETVPATSDQAHIVAGGGKDLGHAVPDEAVADDCDRPAASPVSS